MPPTCRLPVRDRAFDREPRKIRPCIRRRTSQDSTVHSTEDLVRTRHVSKMFQTDPTWPRHDPIFFSIENNANTEHETKETEKENVWSTIAEELYCWHVMRGVDTCYVHIVVYVLFDRAFDRESRKNSTWFTDDANWSNTTLTWPILCNIIVCLCNEYVWK